MRIVDFDRVSTGVTGFSKRLRGLIHLILNVPHYMETSQLICIGNRLTGFSFIEKNRC